MNIGQAAQRSGLNNKTIRYYESIGLVQSRRQVNGYRHYSAADLERLRFLQRARVVGFSLEECRELLELYSDTSRRSADVKALVMTRVKRVETQLESLEAMRETLLDMAASCPGDEGSDCAIIDSLSGPGPHMPFTLK